MKVRQVVGLILTSLMATTTMLGSITGLMAFAHQGDAGVLMLGDAAIPVGTLAFIAGLDGLAISLTVQAHRHGETDGVALVGLLVATLLSTTLQVIAVADKGPAAWVVHGLPAPCTGVAAYFLLRSLDKGHVAPPPPPVGLVAEDPGVLTAEGPAPAPAADAPAPSPAPGVPLAKAEPVRTDAPSSGATRGRKVRGPRSAGPAPVKGDELVRRVAVHLTEREQSLTNANVEAAIRHINRTCSRSTRDQVYAALAEPDGLSVWATSVNTPPKEQ